MGFYGNRELFVPGVPSSGAVLFMRQAAQDSVEYTTEEGWSVSAREGERGLVIRGAGMRRSEDVLNHAEESSHIALDIFSATRGVTSTLVRPSDLYIAWWCVKGRHVVRISSTDTMQLRGKARGIAKGGAVESEPPGWHPSLRYYRHANTTSDLLDAFRNIYLALESIISDFRPKREGEAEAEWLRSALKDISGELDLRPYTSSVSKDPEDAIVEKVYTDARTATFHSKHGRRVILPYGADRRKSLALTTRQMRDMYAGIAQAHLGIHVTQGSRFVGRAYGIMFDSVVDPSEMYISPDASKEQKGARGVPGNLRRLHRSSKKSSKDGFLSTVTASVGLKEEQLTVREFGLLLNNEIGLFNTFETPLELCGSQTLEVSISVRGGEEGSSVPVYVT